MGFGDPQYTVSGVPLGAVIVTWRYPAAGTLPEGEGREIGWYHAVMVAPELGIIVDERDPPESVVM